MQNNFIGVDVSKDWLDLCEPGRGAQRTPPQPKLGRKYPSVGIGASPGQPASGRV